MGYGVGMNWGNWSSFLFIVREVPWTTNHELGQTIPTSQTHSVAFSLNVFCSWKGGGVRGIVVMACIHFSDPACSPLCFPPQTPWTSNIFVEGHRKAVGQGWTQTPSSQTTNQPDSSWILFHAPKWDDLLGILSAYSPSASCIILYLPSYSNLNIIPKLTIMHCLLRLSAFPSLFSLLFFTCLIKIKIQLLSPYFCFHSFT